MNINKFETHDRFQQFTKQSASISDCCQNLIDQRPFGNHSFYIWLHCRTAEDGFTKELIWQPRLTKPKPQTNSMLFKAYPGTDNIKIIWMIPVRELWDQYDKGLITENKIVKDSIHSFRFTREKLEIAEDDDYSEEQINKIYRDISQQARITKLKNEVVSSN